MAQSTTDPRAVATVFLKGGTSKSTVTANLGDELAQRGHRVLLVDTDPNGHMTVGLGYREAFSDGDQDLGDVLLGSGTAAPADIILETEFGFDLLPATNTLETVNDQLKNEMTPSLAMKEQLIEPLLNGEGDVAYDYILIDTASTRNTLLNTSVVGAENVIMPITAESGSFSGIRPTVERVIAPLRQRIGLDVLAVVPNKLDSRLDYQTTDRELISRLVTSDILSQAVPNFAYVSPETLEAITTDEWDGPLPKPGIRQNAALGKSFEHNQTARAYDPDYSQRYCFEELAEIVERGGVERDD